VLVAVYYNNRDVRIKEVARPVIGDKEILVKVMASGICGSDVMEWYRVPKAPKILGHEATGVIEKVGSEVTGYNVGDRVFVSHHVPCDKCYYCLRDNHTACETLHSTNYFPGGFAQFIRVPEINVKKGIYKLPSEISFEEGTFIEPLGCVVRGQRLVGVQKDDVLLVIGSGISGILHVQLAKYKGVKRVIVADINSYRLGLAEKFGADFALDAKCGVPQKLKNLNGGRLADKVVICTGATQAALMALNCVDKGGSILFFAVPEPEVKLPIPINQFWRNEITLKTSYGAAPNDLAESLAILFERKLNVRDMITHKLSLRQAAEGFRLMAEAGASLKVILEPNRA
jgi:L-iditol 2-dehydrogenase